MMAVLKKGDTKNTTQTGMAATAKKDTNANQYGQASKGDTLARNQAQRGSEFKKTA